MTEQPTTILATAPHAVAWIAFLICIVGIIVLAALGKPIPDILQIVSGVTSGGGLGLSMPGGTKDQ